MVDHKVDHFTYTKRGFYYYSRRVPLDLQKHYRKNRVVIALKTKVRSEASTEVGSINGKLERFWSELRLSNKDIPAMSLLVDGPACEPIASKLSIIMEQYLTVKGEGKGELFRRTSERAVNQLVLIAGDLPLDKYQRRDANGLRDKLLKDGLAPQSVKRRFTSLKAIFNFGINEQALSYKNPFIGIIFGQSKKVKARLPISNEDIQKVQAVCYDKDDANRWLVALISDTGMRLSEALGLHSNDLMIDQDIPFVHVTKHPWRRLKTDGSERQIPLVGASLWAAKRIKEQSGIAFPKYTTQTKCNANSASAALNKWMKPYVKDGCVIHSFRHSLRDRLRAVQCPSDVVDQLGGWTGSITIGQGYGQGYPLGVLEEWMKRVCF